MSVAKENNKLNGPGQTEGKGALNPNVWGTFIHLSQLFAYFIPLLGLAVPFILWQTKKKKSDIIDQQGRIVANWIFTELLICLVIIPLNFIGIGIFFLILLIIVGNIFLFIGAAKAINGEFWNYPCSIKFFPVKEGRTIISDSVKAIPGERVKSISELVRFSCNILIALSSIVLVLAFCNMFLDMQIRTNVYVTGRGYTSIYFLSFSGKLIMAIEILLVYGILLKSLYHLRKLFNYYAEGMIFTKEVNRHIRQFGVIVILLPFLIYVIGWLTNLAVYYSFAVGKPDLSIPMSGSIISYIRIIIAGVAIICISLIMDAGIRIRKDQNLII